MSELASGDLDRRITIETPQPGSKSGSGAKTPTWTEFAKRWASKRDLKGREYFEGRQDQGEVTTEFRIRYLTGLKREMRILLDGLVYDIVHIAEIGRREGQLIHARAKVE